MASSAGAIAPPADVGVGDADVDAEFVDEHAAAATNPIQIRMRIYSRPATRADPRANDGFDTAANVEVTHHLHPSGLRDV